MTKHKTIEQYEIAFEDFIFPSLVARKLGVTRQAVYYRLNTSEELKEFWKDVLEEYRYGRLISH